MSGFPSQGYRLPEIVSATWWKTEADDIGTREKIHTHSFLPMPMKILEYTGLDTSRVKAGYRKVTEAIARDDFRAAQVKKLANLSHGKFYRARLDDADRLLFSLVRHGDEVCALMLEVIVNHDYDRSRFLRGAAIDESKIPDVALRRPSGRRDRCATFIPSAPAFICSTSRSPWMTRRRPSIASRRL